MSRAKWKGPYVQKTLLKNFFIKNTKFKYQTEIVTKNRSSSVIPSFVGSFFKIHNGKTFTKIKITETMVGKKLGEFSPTRKKFSFKKKKLK